MRTRPRLAALSAIILTAVAVAVAPATPALAAAVYISVLNPGSTQPTSAQRFVLGIDGARTDNRADAILARYNGNLNQFWTVRVVFPDPQNQGRDVVQIVNAKSGKCLDKSLDAPNANGNRVYQFTCDDLATPRDNQL
ncbi:RICIN domain-containing protein [Paractinoplanes lichenicola]|uniref:RICIN domain-containing protein n=1 Tax=Paractinoplanes lichenicola TaxID=2802976 RepID=A0ABS1VZT4_9ACTN|nr:RICIN domain-containing protein [Actinoplanes lichenicola]MBL7259960.1 RICIN domain-containing protein [Actinoplanes lichenicola]